MPWLPRWIGNPRRRVKVAFNARRVRGSWGGGNQWLEQMVRATEPLGISVRFDLNDDDIDLIWILHSAPWLGGTFNGEQIAEYRARNPRVKVIHRVNENDARKLGATGTPAERSMDRAIREINACADETVFLSHWLKDHHRTQGWSPKGDGIVIWNGASSEAFHPVGAAIWEGRSPLVLMTHHWSDHWNKGFEFYRELDQRIADGRISGVELRVLGRWPKEIQWKSAQTIGPCSGTALGDQLRQAHVYLTASLAEPGGMHFIEGLQCGLPLIYHSDGGGIVEIGRATSGLEFRNASELEQAVNRMKDHYADHRIAALKARPSGERMVAEYLSVMFRVLGGRAS